MSMSEPPARSYSNQMSSLPKKPAGLLMKEYTVSISLGDRSERKLAMQGGICNGRPRVGQGAERSGLTVERHGRQRELLPRGRLMSVVSPGERVCRLEERGPPIHSEEHWEADIDGIDSGAIEESWE